MKVLYLIRHAKSSWADPRLTDHDRPLNKRGKRDIPIMAQRLASYTPRPELIISSTARRARKTARGIGDRLGFDKQELVLIESLYTFSREPLLEVIRSVQPTVTVLCVVGHNYGLTDCAEWLCGEDLGNIPTCGVVLMEIPVDDWKQICRGNGRLLCFDYPKLQG
jgi:phosphohistidine phosphatase